MSRVVDLETAPVRRGTAGAGGDGFDPGNSVGHSFGSGSLENDSLANDSLANDTLGIESFAMDAGGAGHATQVEAGGGNPENEPDPEGLAGEFAALPLADYDATSRGNTWTPAEREQVILEHLPQVRLIARRIHDRLPDSVALEDLISTGVVGLISAIDRFDPTHKVKLKTYAEYKIRGAILDSLRGLDWAPRQQRKRAKQIEAAIAVAEQKLKRAPTEDEIAQELRLSMSEYHEWLVDIRGVNLGSLESHAGEDDGRDLLRFISDKEDNWPSRLLERAELERLLATAIDRMPAMEKTVLSLYYREEMTLREIARIVNLHESRISQLKSQAILRLRSYIEKRWPVDRGR